MPCALLSAPRPVEVSSGLGETQHSLKHEAVDLCISCCFPDDRSCLDFGNSLHSQPFPLERICTHSGTAAVLQPSRLWHMCNLHRESTWCTRCAILVQVGGKNPRAAPRRSEASCRRPRPSKHIKQQPRSGGPDHPAGEPAHLTGMPHTLTSTSFFDMASIKLAAGCCLRAKLCTSVLVSANIQESPCITCSGTLCQESASMQRSAGNLLKGLHVAECAGSMSAPNR